jgi:exopolysaccharide production protein ExoY
VGGGWTWPVKRMAGTPPERVPHRGGDPVADSAAGSRERAPGPWLGEGGAGGATAVAPGASGWLAHPLKRAIDLALAVPGLVLALPVLFVIALAIRLDSGGAGLFRQLRVGRGGRLFPMFKFRTMRNGAEESLQQRLGDDAAEAAAWRDYQKLASDPRVTRVGRFLRRYSLDELPQLWNVVRGDMTLVGARPILPDQAVEYGPAFVAYTRTPPGLTGLWQVSGRSRLSFRERVARDERYRRVSSFGMDVSILLRTIVVVATRDGAW